MSDIVFRDIGIPKELDGYLYEIADILGISANALITEILVKWQTEELPKTWSVIHTENSIIRIAGREVYNGPTADIPTELREKIKNFKDLKPSGV